MKFKATEFRTAHEAIEHAEATEQNAIRMNEKYFSLPETETDRLLEGRVEFAFIADHNGKIVTIPTA
jgi:hypothetical protein